MMNILCIAHDFFVAGAQTSLLRIMKHLHFSYNVKFAVITLGEGSLQTEYEKLAPILSLNPSFQQYNIEEKISLFLKKEKFNPSCILANTIVTPQIFPYIARMGIPIVTRVAELESSIIKYSQPEWIHFLNKYSSAIVAVSAVGQNMLINKLNTDKEKTLYINGTIESCISFDPQKRKNLLLSHNIPLNVPLLWGCGSISKRKGADLFLLCIKHLQEMNYTNFHAIWVGTEEDSLSSWLYPGFTAPKVHFVGYREQPASMMSPQDIFLLTSREDPFPLVALEAGSRGLPIVGFADSGGMTDIISCTSRMLAPNSDSLALAKLVANLFDDSDHALYIATRTKKLIHEEYTIEQAGKKWMALFKKLSHRENDEISLSKQKIDVSDFFRQREKNICAGIVRTIGERTTALSYKLLSSLMPNNKIAIVSEKPFSKTLKEGFIKGIETGADWIITIDADVLICDTYIAEALKILENAPKNLFVLQGLVCDKFFGILRPAGNHIFRTSLLYEALSYIPEEGTSIRPESDTIQEMVKRGYKFWQKPFLVGLHDYEQYYKDIVNKCFLQAKKHKDYLPLTEWQRLSNNDKDFKFALEAAQIGLEYHGQIFIDTNFLNKKTASLLSQIKEKDKTSIRNLWFPHVRQEMEVFIPRALTSSLQKMMFPTERWDVES